MEFLRGEPIFGLKNREPEPERTGTGWTELGGSKIWVWTEPNRTVGLLNRGINIKEIEKYDAVQNPPPRFCAQGVFNRSA